MFKKARAERKGLTALRENMSTERLSSFSHLKSPQTFPHLDPLALLHHGGGLMVFMVPLCAFLAHRHLVSLAEHRQRLVVVSAEVAGGEGGRIGQPVSLQGWIPQVCCEVKLTVRRLANQARLDRRRLVPVADVTGNIISLERLVWGRFPAFWWHHNIDVLLLCW